MARPGSAVCLKWPTIAVMKVLVIGLLAAAATSALVAGPSLSGSIPQPVLGPVPGPSVAGPLAAVWPVQPPHVERGFEGPEQYGPGHRGVDLVARPGQRVRSALPGRVQFAGRVAGRSIVVIAHEGNVRTTYLPVKPRVEVGDLVDSAELIGRLTAEPHCPTGPCLHWGARRHDTYIDPLILLPGRVVLLPAAELVNW